MAIKSEPPESFDYIITKTEVDEDGVRGQGIEIEVKVEPIEDNAEGIDVSSYGTCTSTEPSTDKSDTPTLSSKCNFCYKKFNDLEKYRKHMLQHSIEKKYTCVTCKRRYLEKEKLGIHLLRHADLHTLLCNVCQRVLNNKEILGNHMFIHSFEEFTCDLCNETFPNKTKMTVHVRKHKGGNVYLCGFCKKEFETPSGLKGHERTHSGVRPYLCEICKQSFNRLSKLHRHMREHSGSKPQKCGYCERRFVRSQDLERHAATHEENNSDSDSYEK